MLLDDVLRHSLLVASKEQRIGIGVVLPNN